jgi:uncharacterized protein (TIGR02246 family)
MINGSPLRSSKSRPAKWRVPAFCWVWLIIMVTSSVAQADQNADKRAITGRLEHWASAFNERDAAGVCDLFAPDLVSTVPGALQAGRDTVCRRLARLLAEPGLNLSYHPNIEEIIVSGNFAFVRLFWTLTTIEGGQSTESVEAGLDVFQRQADGRWSIIRFLAFTT